jgi:nucleoside-diphosphate-sugar epimerase
VRALVTGGGGFLGTAIARALVARGAQVTTFSRGDHPHLATIGTAHIRGDIGEPSAVAAAAAGHDVVFHAAALAGFWGTYEEYHRANVVGTANTIAACRRHGIGRLVFTSSPSVVFDGGDQAGVDERVPYPPNYLAFYPQTKAAAERLVLSANGPELATVALRPHLIWGPGDPHLIARFVARAKAGRLMQVGMRDQLVDTIYIDNAAEAHVQAGAALAPGSPVAGKAYFLSQGEPRPCWEMINAFLLAANAPTVTRRIPAPAAYVAGAVLETVYRVLQRTQEPPMTRFLARQLSTSHWFDISAARRDFGFSPAVSIDQGLSRLAATYQAGR